MLGKKSSVDLPTILELCNKLSIQQLYRISTMFWDEKYNTETVSQQVRVWEPGGQGLAVGVACLLAHGFLKEVRVAPAKHVLITPNLCRLRHKCYWRNDWHKPHQTASTASKFKYI